MSNLNCIKKLALDSDYIIEMMKFHKILFSPLLINIALLVLFINNAKISATRFHSTTIEANGDLMLPKQVDQFGRQSWIGFSHNVYFNTREKLRDPSRSHYRLFQPGNVGRILRLTPSGPNNKHNPGIPDGNVGHILRRTPSGPNRKHNPNIPGANINV